LDFVSKAFFCLLALQYVAIKAYNIFNYPFYRSPLRHLPGPKARYNHPNISTFKPNSNASQKDGHIFLGQAYKLYKTNGPHDLRLSWMRQLPDASFICYLTFTNTELLLVNNLQAHREVLRIKCYEFENLGFFRRVVRELVGVGLLITEGGAQNAAEAPWWSVMLSPL